MERKKRNIRKITLFGLTTSMIFTSAGLGAFFIPQSFQSEVISYAEEGNVYTVNNIADLQNTIDNAETGDKIRLAGIKLTGSNFKITKSITIEGTLDGENISTICENNSTENPFFGVVGNGIEVHFKNIKFTKSSGENVIAISKKIGGEETVGSNCNIYIGNCSSEGVSKLVDAGDNNVVISNSNIIGTQGCNVLSGTHFQLQNNTFEINNSSYIDSTPILSSGNKFMVADEIDEDNLSTLLSTLGENDVCEIKEDQDFEISLVEANYKCKLKINGFLTVSGNLTNHIVSSEIEIGEDGDLFILGGRYSFDVSKYVATGYIANKDQNVWTICESKKVTYYRNASDDDTENFCREYAVNSEFFVINNLMNYSKNGYVFGGWNTSKDGCGTHYDIYDEMTINTNVSLYAQWAHINNKGTETEKEFNKLISNNLPTEIISDVTYFVLDNGNYYLSENIDLQHNIIVKSNKNVSICLNGYILKGCGNQSTITVQENGTLSLYDCGDTNAGKITRSNNLIGNGGGICNNGTFLMYGGSIYGISLTGNGAGVYNNGTCKMYAGEITQNNSTTGNGGAIYNNGTLEISGGKISYNNANLGSAIYNQKTLSISGSLEISNNSGNEGTIYIYGSDNSSEIKDIEIKNNTANKNGGAICVKDTTDVTLDNVTLSKNSSYINGGAIYVLSGGGINIKNSQIVNNTTDKIGGGIYNSGKIDLYNTTIKNNKAKEKAGGVFACEGSFNYIGGKIIVNENIDNDNAKNNLYLDSNIKLTIKENYPLVSGSLISLSLPTKDNRDLTYPSENNSAEYFATDFDSDYTLLRNCIDDEKNILKLITFSEINLTTTQQSVVYDGSIKNFEITGENSNLSGYTIKYYQNNIEVEPIKSGLYDVKIIREEKGNFFAYDKFIEGGLKINKISVEKPQEDDTDFVYNYLDQTYNLATSQYYNITGYMTRNTAGSQNIIVSLKDKENTQWIDESSDDLTYVFTIKKLTVAKPEEYNGTYKYDGSKKIYPVVENKAYTITGNEQTMGGTHEVRIHLKSKTNMQWEDETTDDIVYDFVIQKRNLSIPSGDQNTFTYNGYEQTYSLATSQYYTIVGNKQTNAGTYTVKVSINEPDNYMWKNKDSEELTYTFIIKQIEVAKPEKDENEFVYDKTEKIYNIPENDVYKVSNNKQTNAGQYIVSVSFKDKVNYKWIDGDSSNLKYEFTIQREKVQLPIVDLNKKYVYNGESQNFAIEQKDYLVVSNGSRLNAGSQTVYVSLINQNYAWVDGTRSILKYSFVIEQKEVNEPTLKAKSFIYNGSIQTPEMEGFESYMNIARGDSGCDVADYEMIITLNSNYKWNKNSDGKITWKIEPKNISNAVVTLENTLIYNGLTQTQKVKSVVVDGLEATYIVSNNKAKETGSHVLTITGCGNFTGTIQQEYLIKRSIIDSQKDEVILEIPSGLDEDVLADIESDKSIERIYADNPNKDSIIENIMSKMDKDEYIIKIYDITLKKNSQEYNTSQEITIKFLIHNDYNIGSLRVLKVHNGSVEEVRFIVKNDYIVITVNELSEFVLVTKEVEEEKMDLITMVIIGLSFILFLCEIFLLSYYIKDKKRRKYEEKLLKEIESIKAVDDIQTEQSIEFVKSLDEIQSEQEIQKIKYDNE